MGPWPWVAEGCPRDGPTPPLYRKEPTCPEEGHRRNAMDRGPRSGDDEIRKRTQGCPSVPRPWENRLFIWLGVDRAIFLGELIVWLTAQIIRTENPGVRATAPSAVNMFQPHLTGEPGSAAVHPPPQRRVHLGPAPGDRVAGGWHGTWLLRVQLLLPHSIRCP